MKKVLKRWLKGLLLKAAKTPQRKPEKALPDLKKFLIIGLGNIGEEYTDTRHNIGFKILDALTSASGVSFRASRLADRAEFSLKGRTFVLIKPTTFMNLSGKAVNYWLQQEKIPLQNLLVVVDDVALPFGALRLKNKGSDGGHNGLKSIQQVLGSQNYARLRFGIGNDFPQGGQVNYVLGQWSEEQYTELDQKIQTAAEAIKSFGLAGPQDTMTRYNRN